jgi:hypothetical protein
MQVTPVVILVEDIQVAATPAVVTRVVVIQVVNTAANTVVGITVKPAMDMVPCIIIVIAVRTIIAVTPVVVEIEAHTP